MSMARDRRMIDISEDLMHDIREFDACRDRRQVTPNDRVTAAVLRRLGFSDNEIVADLGYLPDPIGKEVRKAVEPEAESFPAPTRS